MTAIIQTFLTLIEALLPSLGADTAIVETILTSLIQLVPMISQEVATALPAVKNIIAALSANPAATADQLATLATLDKQVDDAFEASVAAYNAAHPGDAA